MSQLDKKGFSLLEILFGLAILSGMSLLIYTTMNRALTAKARMETRDELLQSVRVGMDRIITDLEQAFTANAALKGPNNIQDTGMKGAPEELNFSTMSHFHYLENARDSDQTTVGYSLKKNNRGLFDLVRREGERLSEKIDEGGAKHLLIENIKTLMFSYYDSNKKEWVSQWDSSQLSVLGRLPEAVKIELTVVSPEDEESAKGREYVFSTAVMLKMYKNEINF